MRSSKKKKETTVMTPPPAPLRTHMDEEGLRSVTVDALKYVAELAYYIPAILADEESANWVIKSVSKNMRRKLSKPVAFAVLQVLMRISDFSEETENATSESRRVMLPKIRNDVDYTVRKVWARWATATDEECYRLLDWRPPLWNPYSEITRTLNKLCSHLWEKHFLVKDL